jgi:hypothetical protein
MNSELICYVVSDLDSFKIQSVKFKFQKKKTSIYIYIFTPVLLNLSEALTGAAMPLFVLPNPSPSNQVNVNFFVIRN